MNTIYRFVRNGGLLIAILCLLSIVVKSQTVEKVTSINYYGYNGLNPSELTVFDGKLFFLGTDDPQYVDKLMFTADGSAAGVTVVKQIDSVKQYPSLHHLAVLNGLLIFDNHYQLWKSDGTAGGTSSIATLTIGSEFFVMNGKAYFVGDSTNSYPMNDQLWQTDGTASGTTLVKTINSKGPAYISNVFSYDGKLYFGATDSAHSSQLWISDGTAAGTTLLKIVNPAGTASPSSFMAYNGKVYFSANDNASGSQLWVTDGTTDGTLKITHRSAGLYPALLTGFNSKLFFRGYDENGFSQLWSTDGTDSGTVLIKADSTVHSGSPGFCPNSIVVYNNKLYMSGWDSAAGTQLWASDGTPEGTTRITNIQWFGASRLYPFHNKLIMTGYDSVTKAVELFVSDGTAAGMVCPTPPSNGVDAFYPWQAWVPFNNSLYYRAAYGYFGDYQLCRFTDKAVSVKETHTNELPGTFALSQNYPNPFNPATAIHYQLPYESQVHLSVYNMLGREVATLVNGTQEAGYKSAEWNANGVASGVYFYKLEAAAGGKSFMQVRKMILVK